MLEIQSGMKDTSPGTILRKLMENRGQEIQVLLSAGGFKGFGGLRFPAGQHSREKPSPPRRLLRIFSPPEKR
jgi:hypothetical protein